MAKRCPHIPEVAAPPASDVCKECVAEHLKSVALRVCQTCGHVGCCDSSEGTHARKHYHATQHPTITPLTTPDKWTWCYVDDAYV